MVISADTEDARYTGKIDVLAKLVVWTDSMVRSFGPWEYHTSKIQRSVHS